MEQAIKKNTGQIDLTEGSVVKSFLSFMVPIIIGNIFTQLYNTADSIIVGQFVGSNALAALGACFPLNMIINSFLVSVGAGATVVVSQYYGAKNQEGVSRTVNNALILASLVALGITVIGLISAKPVLNLLKTPEEIFDDAYIYLVITIIGTLGHLYYQMGSAILRGMGDSVFPLIMLIFCSLLNIVLDLLFVAVFHWGVAGAAWATILAQLISGITLIMRLTGKRYNVKVNRNTLKIEKDIAKPILFVGVPAGLQMLVYASGSSIVQGFTNTFGSNIIAANSSILKIDGFIILPNMAISTAIQAFVGQNIGAGKIDRLKKGNRVGMLFSIAISVVLGLVFVAFAPGAIGLFTSEAEVVRIGSIGLRTLGFFYVFQGISQCITGIVRGAGQSTVPMLTAFVNIGLRTAFSYILAVRTNDYKGLYYAMIIGNAANALIMIIYYKLGSWRKASIVKKAEPMVVEESFQ